jgi:hypothetical protein
LTPEQRSDLVAFLSEWYTFGELRDLAFELGAGFDVFSRQSVHEFALALVHCLERVDRLGCLVERVRKGAAEYAFPALPDPSRSCVTHRKVEFTLPGDWDALSLPTLRRDLAVALGVPEDGIVWMGAAGDQVRLLVSLPDTGTPLPDPAALSNRYDGGKLQAFGSLRRSARGTWREVVRRWAPEMQGVRLVPAVSWDSAHKTGAARGGWILPLTVVLLGVGVLAAYQQLRPRIPGAMAAAQAFGTNVLARAVPWAEFLGSVLLSLLALSWLTTLLFVLSAMLLHWLPRLAHGLALRYPANAWWPRLRDAVHEFTGRYSRIVGTVLVLASSACALLLFSRLFRRPLDYWDLGIQAAFAVILELIVLSVALRATSFEP